MRALAIAVLATACSTAHEDVIELENAEGKADGEFVPTVVTLSEDRPRMTFSARCSEGLFDRCEFTPRLVFDAESLDIMSAGWLEHCPSGAYQGEVCFDPEPLESVSVAHASLCPADLGADSPGCHNHLFTLKYSDLEFDGITLDHEFPSVPSGDYLLVLDYRDMRTLFDFALAWE
jgi:hypothetical protein